MSSSSSSSSESSDISNDIYESVKNKLKRSVENLKRLIACRNSRRQPKKRKSLQRERLVAESRLMRDYFVPNATYEASFRRRFRMHRPLFERIVNDVAAYDSFFEQAPCARGTIGFHPLHKCTAAFRMLAYGTVADAIDENFRMSARIARDSMIRFCDAIRILYGPRYLRWPNASDVQQLQAHHTVVHGLPGMLGSIDCMHWVWQGCPNAYKGQYSRGSGEPTVVLEAMASQDLWFWHGYFGTPGSNNDINIINSSPFFVKLYDGTAADSSFTLQGTQYKYGYYLGDGIYPTASVIVKSLTCPGDERRRLFKTVQEKARKDIERAFGVLKKQFAILKRPAMFTTIETMQTVMYACMILHNMIIEDEGRAICVYNEEEVVPEPPPLPVGCSEYIQNVQVVHNSDIHHALRCHLTDHLWNLENIDLNAPAEDENEYSDEDNLGFD